MKTSFHFQGINKNKPAARLLLASAIGLACLPASADDKVWLGADGNYWGNPANWDGGLPAATDNAILDNPAPALVGANASAGNVVIGATGTGRLAVGGDAGATLTVSGSVLLAAAATGDGALLLARSGNLATGAVAGGPGAASVASDGGFVTALSDNDNFFNGIAAVLVTATHASIGGNNSGLTLNTNGFSLTATNNFSFASSGAKTSRGLAKTGAGILTLTGNVNLAGGRVDITAGELALGGTLAAAHAQNLIGFDANQSGTLRVLAGGTVGFGGALIGDRAGANGVLVLETGAGYYATGDTVIGNTAGAGVVTIKSGATLNSARNYLGGGSASGAGTGVVVVEGGGVFVTRGRLDIGTRGSGTLRLIDSATVMATGIVLGRVAGGSGVIEITGTKGASITGTNGSGGISVNQDSAAAGGVVRFMHSDTNYITSLSLRNLTRLEHTGSGLTALIAANSHTLGTLISAGTLQIGNNTASGALAGDVENNATLAVYRGNDYDFAANISGTGVLVKKGNAKLTLTGANTYTGGNIVEAGALAGTLDKIRGAVTMTSTGATLEINVASGGGTLSASVTGQGNFAKTGDGFLLLGSAVNYTGNTTVGAGALKGRVGAGVLDVAAGATYVAADGAQNATLANITGSGTVNLNNASLVFGVSSGTQTYGFTGALTGGRDLRKTGGGLLDLGAHALAPAFSGDTFVEGGTLRLDSVSQLPGGLVLGGAGAVGLIEQTSGALTQSLALAGQGGGISVSGGTQTFAATVNGTGDFAKGGDGTLDVRGATMNQSGGTRILGGTLLGDADVIKGDITLANGATVEFAQNTAGTVAGLVTGGGNLIKTGAGELTLANNANNYIGDTTINSGTLKGAIGAGTLTVAAGATYKVADGAAEAALANITGDGTVDLNAASLRLVAAAGVTSTFSYNNLVSSNPASRLIKTGAGRIVLDAAVALGGGVAVEDGVLELDSLSKINAPVALGTGSTYGLIGYTNTGVAWTHAVTLDGLGGGFVVDAASGTVTLAATATIGGAGDFHKSGPGALDITAAAMNNTGDTRVLGGTLIGDTATIKGDADIAAGATLRFRQASTGTFAGMLTGPGALRKTGPGTLVLGSALNAYGDTIIDEGVLTGAIGAGTLTVNAGGTYRVTDGVTEFELEGIAGAGTVDLNAANLTFNVASGTAQFSFTGSLAGGNRFIKAGAGTLELLSSVALAQGASLRGGVVRLADQAFINAPVELGSASSYGLIEYTNEGAAWTRALTLAGQGGGFSVEAGKTIALAASTTISGAGDF
ncbi:MAG: autotransporter-associated beta strand repeat-containing protein, partial [Opitutaceae bacterium]|nr:autotransporter-associated beta strand repeat-containing protein [Opitutaceae bacterium]